MVLNLSWSVNGSTAVMEYDAHGRANEKQVSIVKKSGLFNHCMFLIMCLVFAVLLGLITYKSDWEDCILMTSVKYDPKPLGEEASKLLEEIQARQKDGKLPDILPDSQEIGDNITPELKGAAHMVFSTYCVAAGVALLVCLMTLIMSPGNFGCIYCCKNCLACLNCPLLTIMMIYMPLRMNQEAVEKCVGISANMQKEGVNVLQEEQQRMQSVYIGMLVSYFVFFCCCCCAINVCYVGK